MQTRRPGHTRSTHRQLNLEPLEARCLLSGGPTAPLVGPIAAAPTLVQAISSAKAVTLTIQNLEEKEIRSDSASVANAYHVLELLTDPNADKETPPTKTAEKEYLADLLPVDPRLVFVLAEQVHLEEDHRILLTATSSEANFSADPQTKFTDTRLPDGFVSWMHPRELENHPLPLALMPPFFPSEQLVVTNPILVHVEDFLAEPRSESISLTPNSTSQSTPRMQPLRVVAEEISPTADATYHLSVQAASLADGGTLEAGELEQTFHAFLEAMTDLEQTNSAWPVSLGAAPWVFMGLALLGTAYGALRQMPDTPPEEELFGAGYVPQRET